jgi:Transposase DDE domain group 1
MQTECRNERLKFQVPGARPIVAEFNGGTITSDGGVLLLQELEAKRQIIKQFADCFTDHRDQEKIEHPMKDLLAQRIYGLALGYEDLNDHDLLRKDPLLAAVVGKDDPSGEQRRRAADRGSALAGKSTLNRLELRTDEVEKDGRYKKIAIDATKVDKLFVKIFLQAHDRAPEIMIVDLDATDDPLHGHQEGRFFHGYYGHYCYLPLYIFCGDFLLGARLRLANEDPGAGALEEIQRIVEQVREQWPAVQIILRGDSGFSREALMSWCESQPGVDYVFGQAKNERLLKLLSSEMEEAKQQFAASGQAVRVFGEKRYQTLESWSRERRVVGKAEHLAAGANPRFNADSIFMQRGRPIGG